MINLCNRTEYSFRLAFGHIQNVLNAQSGNIAGICDRHGTWGHVAWEKLCKKNGVKPVFGVELALVDDAKINVKEGQKFLRFIALNNVGLKKMYELTTLATRQFYYLPRIDKSDIADLGKDVAVLTTWPLEVEGLNVYLDLNPSTPKGYIEWAIENNIEPLATSDNYYPAPEDKAAYETCIGSRMSNDKSTSIHILDEWDLQIELDGICPPEFIERAIRNSESLGEAADVTLPRAKLPHPPVEKTLKEMCEEAAPERGIDLTDKVYRDRLDRELSLIAEKEYEDYFYIISDLCRWAKKTMLLSPARGSSCGSLVCYLLYITDIDPIPYDLIFERFIDINRADLPDIDIDFPDVKRNKVLKYLRETYGETCVAQLGTVNRFKAKSTISECAKELQIPLWDVEDLKDAIIERSGGDSRAAYCIMDTFQELDIGKKTLEKYPELKISEQIEAHARHSGKHAAGIIVTSDPVSWYCSVDEQTGCSMVDKIDAEELNLLKIDALGLRTLTVIEDCLKQIGWKNQDLLNHPLNDQLAFTLINDGKFSGIFQYEGYALQSLCHQFKVENFEDIVSVTALARPGPLNSGMANEWVKRRIGERKIEYEHPMLEPILRTSYGVVIYQENIMRIAREIGKLSWEDVSALRKAMSKSLGKEFFDGYKAEFLKGAEENNIDLEFAEDMWNRMNTFGSWAFNRSHAVAYGMVSYWCMVLKAHYPLEYAAACLRHAKDDKQIIMILRELDKEGYEYEPYNKELSKENWIVHEGKLIGGLTGIKGIGVKIAKDIIKRRKNGDELTGKQLQLLDEGKTAYDSLYEGYDKWGHVLENPYHYNITSRITEIKEITSESEGIFVFIGKITNKNQRDHNELVNIQKRGGTIMKGQTLYLNLVIEDDTDSIICTIDKHNYMKYGKPIIEDGKADDWYLFKGFNRKGFRRINISRWIKLTGTYEKENWENE